MVGVENSAVVAVQNDIKVNRNENGCHVQVGIIPEDDYRRATGLLNLVSTHFLNSHYVLKNDSVAWSTCFSLFNRNVAPEKNCEKAVSHIHIVYHH